MEVTLSSKNQIVVPKDVRQQLNLAPGDRLSITPGKNFATIKKAPSIRQELDRIMKMSPPTNNDVVGRIRKLRDEWNDNSF